MVPVGGPCGARFTGRRMLHHLASNQFVLFSTAVSFLQWLCPDPFPLVSLVVFGVLRRQTLGVSGGDGVRLEPSQDALSSQHSGNLGWLCTGSNELPPRTPSIFLPLWSPCLET